MGRWLAYDVVPPHDVQAERDLLDLLLEAVDALEAFAQDDVNGLVKAFELALRVGWSDAVSGLAGRGWGVEKGARLELSGGARWMGDTYNDRPSVLSDDQHFL